MGKRELMLRVFHNEPAERTPVGFWFHHAEDELVDAFKEPGIIDINIAGHEHFFREVEPDFLKIMTDGYFAYPNEVFVNAGKAAELGEVKPLGPDHPWIREQVKFARRITGAYGKEVLTFYNIFSPATYFKFARLGKGKNPDTLLADFIQEDRAAVLRALNAAAEDLAALARAVIREGGADGIYFSARDIEDPRIDEDLRRECAAPPDIAVLDEAQAAGGLNILHICSYAGHRNDISHYTDYPAPIINWAALLEKVPLGVGKKLFGGKPVIGGFGNTTEDILFRGSREEIEAETDRLLEEAGRRGVVLGADCTVPRNINRDHLRWVRDRAAGN